MCSKQSYIQLQNIPTPANPLLSSTFLGLKQQLVGLILLFLISRGKYPVENTPASSIFDFPLLIQSQLSQFVNIVFNKNNTSIIPIVMLVNSFITGNNGIQNTIGSDLLKFLCSCVSNY